MEHLAGQYFLNADLSKKELSQQIAELAKAGYENIFFHARAGLKVPYLSEAWFDFCKFAAEEMRKHNMKFSIWDEDNFPSGQAGNRIAVDRPELSSSYLEFTGCEVSASEKITEFFSEDASLIGAYAVYSDGSIEDISCHCGTLRKNWNQPYINNSCYSRYGSLPYPHRRRAMDYSRMALQWTAGKDCRIILVGSRRVRLRHNSDLMNPEAVELFIKYTFEEYEKRCGENFLQDFCSCSFMDEPSLAGFWPWTRNFAGEFFKDHNYELKPLLPHLVMDIDNTSCRIRHDYRTTQHRLLCQNYLEKIQQFLKKYNIYSTGHLTRSENISGSNGLWPNELRCFKYLDIPCGDPLGLAIGRRGMNAHHIGLKTVSSAARLFGKKAAGADAFAVGGDCVSLRELKFMLNYHLVMGITWFNIHGLYYTLDGERKDEAPPSLFYQHSQWPHMPAFLEYLKQRCRDMSGEHSCSIAFLYNNSHWQSQLQNSDNLPDEQLHELAEKLLSNQRDFELIDEITLLEQEPEAFARLRPYFIVAYSSVVTGKTAAFLEHYTACGGKLLIVGCVPHILDKNMIEWSFARKYPAPANFVEQLPGETVTGYGSRDILCRRISKDDRSILFLFNRSERIFTGTVNGSNVVLAPGEGEFLHQLIARNTVDELTEKIELHDLRLTFAEANCIGLNFWEAPGRNFVEILSNSKQTAAEDNTFFKAAFDVLEPLESLYLAVDDSMLAMGKFYLNGNLLDKFEKTDFRDCRMKQCDLLEYLKDVRNTLEYEGVFFEGMPYLRGKFQCCCNTGLFSCPRLAAAPDHFDLPYPRDFRTLGYGTYSGMAVYELELQVAVAGKYFLPLDSINDSCRVLVDEKVVAFVIAPPYQLVFELQQGVHKIKIELCNGPGNREIMADLPAGLL